MRYELSVLLDWNTSVLFTLTKNLDCQLFVFKTFPSNSCSKRIQKVPELFIMEVPTHLPKDLESIVVAVRYLKPKQWSE